MRLIDALELKRSIACSSILEDGKTLEQIIDELPTIEERKTGRWIPQKDKWGDYVTTVDGYVCSECNNFDCMEENYCPNCGARMEGEG